MRIANSFFEWIMFVSFILLILCYIAFAFLGRVSFFLLSILSIQFGLVAILGSTRKNCGMFYYVVVQILEKGFIPRAKGSGKLWGMAFVVFGFACMAFSVFQ